MNLNAIKGKLRPVRNRVIVSDMEFGEQKTKSGLIISSDDGNVRGIYPRWGKVYAKGKENKDPYEVGDWVLIEHGRWTRGVLIEDEGEEKTLRMVETESILMWSDVEPETGVQMSGQSVGDYAPDQHTAEDFGAR